MAPITRRCCAQYATVAATSSIHPGLPEATAIQRLVAKITGQVITPDAPGDVSTFGVVVFDQYARATQQLLGNRWPACNRCLQCLGHGPPVPGAGASIGPS